MPEGRALCAALPFHAMLNGIGIGIGIDVGVGVEREREREREKRRDRMIRENMEYD